MVAHSTFCSVFGLHLLLRERSGTLAAKCSTVFTCCSPAVSVSAMLHLDTTLMRAFKTGKSKQSAERHETSNRGLSRWLSWATHLYKRPGHQDNISELYVSDMAFVRLPSERSLFKTTSRPFFNQYKDSGTFLSCLCGDQTGYFSDFTWFFLTQIKWVSLPLPN